jgi:hypothetical protein
MAAQRVESLIREMRGGKLYDSRWTTRMVGSSAYAEGIAKTFHLFVDKVGLNQPEPPLNTSLFRPPSMDVAQLRLF